MEEVINKISSEITKSNREIWMSKIDLLKAYGQAKLSKEASEQCVFYHNWWRLHRPLPFQERLLRAVGYSNRFSRTHRQSTGTQNTSIIR